MYELMLENKRFNDLNPLICGTQVCESLHSFGPAVREYVLLHYVHKGKGILYNSRGAHSVSAGQIFVIRPGESTLYTADYEHPWEYSWIGFDAGIELPVVMQQDVIEAKSCELIFKQMTACGLALGRELFLCGKLYELMAKLYHIGEVELSDSARYIHMAQNYIESNYQKKLRVSQIAENLGLERSYFSNLFKMQLGLSPQQYIVEFRMQKAAELLESKDIPLAEVAPLTGYPDVFSFSRSFRKHFGVAPGQYKKTQNG